MGHSPRLEPLTAGWASDARRRREAVAHRRCRSGRWASCSQVFRAGLDAPVRAHILTHPGHLPTMAGDGDVLTHPWNGSPQPRVAAGRGGAGVSVAEPQRFPTVQTGAAWPRRATTQIVNVQWRKTTPSHSRHDIQAWLSVDIGSMTSSRCAVPALPNSAVAHRVWGRTRATP